MKRYISKIRLKLRNYPIIFMIAKEAYKLICLLMYIPKACKHIGMDIKTILNFKFTSKNIAWFVCVPTHANLGDQAMAYAIRKIIRDQYPEYTIIELTRESFKIPVINITFWLKRHIKNNDIIFVQGGYTSGDKTTNEVVHRTIAKNFKENKIVFFPQTVYYTTESEKNKTANIYNEHGKILFLARDEVSYNSVKSAFKNIEVRVWPDVVSSLIKRNQFETTSPVKDILMCIRDDSEKKYSHSEILQIKKSFEKNLGCKVDMMDLMNSEDDKGKEWYEDTINNTVKKMSEYKVVLTDRFHGILYAMLGSTRVAVLDSIDFKVREGARMFGDMYPNNISYIDNIMNSTEVVHKLYNNKEKVVYDSRCYTQYYKHLREIVDSI